MPQKSSKHYEELGRMLESLYESGHPNPKKLYKTSFIKGVVSGFGGVLGATVLIGLLLWALSFFNRLPFLGPFVDSVKRTVQQQ